MMRIHARLPSRAHWNLALCLAAAALAFPAPARAQADPDSRSMNQPVAPFRIIGNIYYVGASDVTSFLIVTPAGDILLDGGFQETAPQIEANIRTLGFKLSAVKFLLNSHAHYDHSGGLAELKRRTGARLVAMAGDASVLADAGRSDFHFGGKKFTFPPVKPDRVIHDGDAVRLGGVTMTAHRTAGHTRGDTTWTMTTEDSGKTYHVVFIGSMSVLPGYHLTKPESYPGMRADYEKSFAILKALPCDVFLGAHGSFFDLTGKREKLAKGAHPNPFIDPEGYRAYVARAEAEFQAALQRDESVSADPPPQTKDDRTSEGVEKVEQEWLHALETNDAATLAKILAVEWQDNRSNGHVATRKEFLDSIQSLSAQTHSAGDASTELVNTKVRLYGDVAVATGTALRTTTDKTTRAKHQQRTLYTDVFVWREGRWQAVSSQETLVPPDSK
jgi:metallo-beta-lactamase class B